MSNENRVSIQLTATEKTAMETSLTAVKNTLQPYLQSIAVEERITLPKIADGTLPFIRKVLNYCQTEPRFVSPYMELDEFQKDLTAFEELTSFIRQIKQLESQLDDTILLCGYEAYTAALSYYHTVKLASRMDVPGAKPVYEDLKNQFKKTTRKEEPSVQS